MPDVESTNGKGASRSTIPTSNGTLETQETAVWPVQSRSVHPDNGDISGRNDWNADKVRGGILGFLASNLLALVIGGLYEYLALRDIKGILPAWIVLAFVWCVAVLGIVFSTMFWKKEIAERVSWSVSAALLLGVCLFLLDHKITETVSKGISPPAALPYPERTEVKTSEPELSKKFPHPRRPTAETTAQNSPLLTPAVNANILPDRASTPPPGPSIAEESPYAQFDGAQGICFGRQEIGSRNMQPTRPLNPVTEGRIDEESPCS